MAHGVVPLLLDLFRPSVRDKPVVGYCKRDRLGL